MKVEFSVPYRAANQIPNIQRALLSDHLHGDGLFTRRSTDRLREITGVDNILVTTSGTAALEMAVRLLGVNEGDEVITPSFTFSSGATSIVAAGGVPVFIDIDPRTGNIDPSKIEEAITDRTKAISVMHYGGSPVYMGEVMNVAGKFGLKVIEDNAHGLGVRSDWGTLGSIGAVGIQSFHDTKNVHCGEGGALLVNDTNLMQRAEIMREKGTNRSAFLRGDIDKYTWVDWGSSYLPSELNTAVLDAQLEEFQFIQMRRHYIWETYLSSLKEWASRHNVELMSPPNGVHAAHLFFMKLPTTEIRDRFISALRLEDIVATFHYVPLHTSPAGLRFGRSSGELTHTEDFSSRLVRLPLWPSMDDSKINRVIDCVMKFGDF